MDNVTRLFLLSCKCRARSAFHHRQVMLRSAISHAIPRKPHAHMRCWLSTPACNPKPWFIDEEPTPAKSNGTPPIVDDRPVSSSRGMVVVSAAPLPPDLPTHLLNLHAELAKSPLLEPGRLEIRPPLYTPPGPPLPSALPRGRRRRGGTDVGTGVPEPEGSMWRWIVLAQVRLEILHDRS